MPPRDLPFGPETLLIPAYLENGPDDPGAAAWKLEHPDWFIAGTWRSGAAAQSKDEGADPVRLAPGRPTPDAPA